MNTIEKLKKLQDYMNDIEQNNKTIKNGSYLYLLKKMKKNYEKTKEMYIKDKEQLQKLKEEYEMVSKSLQKLKKDSTPGIVCFNGTSGELNEKPEKDSLIKISALERKGDELLKKSEDLIIIIEELRIRLINDKNNYIRFKEKVDAEVSFARKENERVTLLIQEVKKDLSEYLYNRFISNFKTSRVGLVKNKNGLCSNCKSNIVEYLNTESSGDMEIVSCPSCGGILYVYNTKKKVISKISV